MNCRALIEAPAGEPPACEGWSTRAEDAGWHSVIAVDDLDAFFHMRDLGDGLWLVCGRHELVESWSARAHVELQPADASAVEITIAGFDYASDEVEP